MITTDSTTPAEQVRKTAAWVAAHADELVPHGVDIVAYGIDMDITLHLRDLREYVPTVTVSGSAEVFAIESCCEYETQ